MSRYYFELATEKDDAELREILAATPMPGRISVSFHREPSFFDGAVVYGDFLQVAICRDTERKRIAGFGTRSIREMYVNGHPRPIGYLSMLRALEQYRNRGLVARAYRYLNDLHADGRAELYLTTIAEGNDRATSLLTSGRAGLPAYHHAGQYHSVAIPIPRSATTQARRDDSIDLRPATPADLDTLLRFLESIGPARQFFPKYTPDDFCNSRGTFRDLQLSDLLLAFRDQRLVGVLGGWDQHRFRQTVVEGYDRALSWVRPAYNLLARFRGHGRLPSPGEAFRYLTAVLPVVEGDDPEVFAALLEALLARSAGGPCDYLLVGLHETDALLPLVMPHSLLSYVTRLYHVCWPDGERLRQQLDGRPPYLELGCL